MKINQQICRQELEMEGVIPKKFYGQVFTTDKATIKKFIETVKSCYQPGTIIIEIGTGLGYLTEGLSKNFDQIIGVEYDDELFSILYKKFIHNKNLAYLKEKSDKLNKFFTQINECEIKNLKDDKSSKYKNCTHKTNIHLIKGNILDFIPPKKDYLLVGNIPFHISGKLYRKFMSEETHKPYGMVFITDHNYAKTLAGQPPRCYRISLQAQAYGDIEIVEKTPPACVYPEPKVMCCIMKIMQNNIKLPKNFWEVVNYHWEHFPTPEVESPKTMGLKRWLELCKKIND